MAIARLDSLTAEEFSTASHSASKTLNASALSLIVTIHVESTATVPTATSVTYNGVALTKVVGETYASGSTQVRSEIWFLNNPATGANTLAVTLDGTPSEEARFYGASYDQTLTAGNTDTYSVTGTSTAHGAISYTQPSLMIQAVSMNSSTGTETPGAGQTIIYDGTTSAPFAAVVTEETYTSGTSDTPSLSWTNSTRTMSVAAVFNETAAGAPTAPTLLAATRTAGQTTQIDLSWTDNSSDEDGFKIYMRDDTAGETEFTLIDSVGAGVTTFTAKFLKPDGNCYTFRVTAYNAIGESTFTTDNQCTAMAGGTATATFTGFGQGGQFISGGLGTALFTGTQAAAVNVIPAASGEWIDLVDQTSPVWHPILEDGTPDTWTQIVD